MDVVKQAFEKLKGKVEIFSTEGAGCRFVMLVPLTLAIVDGIQVRVGEEQYIIPAVFIKETLRPAREDIVKIHNKEEVVRVRNSLLPIVRLHNLFRVVPQKKNPWEALIVVAECNGQQKGLMIDDLIGKQEVVIKNLGETLESVKGLSGATILGDGRVGLILDVHGVFEIATAA
jgi:two-component system chemotaxis sensor kinase CheA